MNRQQWKAQHSGSQVNHLWLTWAADQMELERQKRKANLRQMGLFLFCLALVAVIAWGVA